MAKKTISNISFKDILKGRFLVQDNAARNWRFLLYIVLLAFLSITSSHWVETKVLKIGKLNDELAEANAKYADIHKELLRGKIKSEVVKAVLNDSLFPSENQPYKLVKKDN